MLRWIINLSQLKESHCNVNAFFKAQKLSIFFCLYGLEVFEDPVCMLYANLCLSQDNGEFETLVLGTHIILNDFLSKKVFETKFSGVIPFMNYTWPDNFEVSFEKAK